MKENLNIDRIFAHIGELGGQQKRYMVLLALMNFYAPQLMIQYTFVGSEVNFRCKTSNGTSLKNSCPEGKISACDEVFFDTEESDSIVSAFQFDTTAFSTTFLTLQNSEWNLVCDRSWLSPGSMTVFMAGVMSGSLVLGSLADMIGRKKTLIITFLMV